jgi:hypothetical protein
MQLENLAADARMCPFGAFNNSQFMSLPRADLARSKKHLLCWMLCLSVMTLAIYQFSENTADPDLWMHVMLGEQSLKTGTIQRTEIYSWTAPGVPFVNHEVLAEALIGGAHLLGGGSGILLLKMLLGLLTFAIALALGGESLSWPQKAVTWVVGAVGLGEISFGFPARPQIFTALALAAQLWLLRRIYLGKLWWALALPPLYAAWINAHGGALAGLLVMVAAAAATTVQQWWSTSSLSRWFPAVAVSKKAALVLWVTCVASFGAMFVNAWGFQLVRWIVVAVLWPRPEIEEWNPTHLGWDHAAFFILALLTIISLAFSRRPRALWEVAACAALMFAASRSVRHTPLFAIAAVAFVPPHLADVLARYRTQFSRIEELAGTSARQLGFSIMLAMVSAAVLVATFTLHKEHPLTMEVPRKQYPVAAVDFMRNNQVRGNMLAFFDWGEMCLWELPDCPVSLDGRMDACYPHETILEHWNFYNAQPVNSQILDISKADVALLPARLAGARELARAPGWKAAYVDDLAVVLVHEPARFPKLPQSGPVQGSDKAAVGRAPFPSQLPPALTKSKVF